MELDHDLLEEVKRIIWTLSRRPWTPTTRPCATRGCSPSAIEAGGEIRRAVGRCDH
ncbi:MAG: hypothetical protein ACLRRT_06470 [Ruthenibacterium lactatiformans]